MQTVSAGSGLQNLGNTCFFNATLQSLLHAPPLAPLLQKKRHSSQCKRVKQWCIFCEMEKVYHGTRQARVYSPSNMLRNLNKVFKKFRLGRQEDSHEFLRYLVEGMQDSETGKLPKGQNEQNEKRIRETMVFEVFGGVMKTVVECLSCGHKSVTSSRYYDFNIECQRANSLHEGISSFFSVDKLEGVNKYLCEHCKVRSNARKRFLLDSIPQVATFQLKRFTNSMRKIGKFMQYPLELDLGKHLEKPKKSIMKLSAVIVHLGGSSFSGHYYAFVRVGAAWYKVLLGLSQMDDSYVSKCSPETVLNQQAYILLYQREKVQQEEKPLTIKLSPPKELIILEEKPEKKTVVEKEEPKKKEQKIVPQEPLPKSPKKQEEAPKIKVNGVSHKNIFMNGIKDDKSEQPQREIPEPLINAIQSRLVSKLSNSQVFKSLQNEKNTVSHTISKVFKEVIDEVSPSKKRKREKSVTSEPQKEESLELPGLVRSKSKQQMEQQMPYAALIMRTVQRILDISAKLPARKPRNPAQRSMYNLRKYETRIQKKRKLG